MNSIAATVSVDSFISNVLMALGSITSFTAALHWTYTSFSSS